MKQRSGSGVVQGEEDIADIIIQRACRTSAGADSFFTTQRMFCVDGTFVTQKTNPHDPPIKIDVFVSSNCEDFFYSDPVIHAATLRPVSEAW